MDQYRDHLGRLYDRPPDAPVVQRVSTYAVILREDGKALIIFPPWDTAHGTLPGGKIEPHESMVEGLLRETFEEVRRRIRLLMDQPFFVIESKYFNTFDDANQFMQNLALAYLATAIGDEPEDNELPADEVVRVEWIDPRELHAGNCHPFTLPIIKYFRETLWMRMHPQYLERVWNDMRKQKT